MPEPLRLDSIQRNPNLYLVVSDGLSEAIKEAGLGPGDKIPSERELGEQFKVSRTVVREAIKHLAAKGVLEVRTGSGVRVATIGHEAVSESIALYLSQRNALDPDKINEVRRALDLKITELAALNGTDDDLERIRIVSDEFAATSDDAEARVRADDDVHRAIARASGNDLLLLLVDSLRELPGERRSSVSGPDQVAVAVEQHRRIVDALCRHDAAGAVAAMATHLEDALRSST